MHIPLKPLHSNAAKTLSITHLTVTSW